MNSGSSPSLEVADQVATITLRRPHHHNRIDPDDPTVLLRHIERVRSDTSIRLLVITGEGERTFCSGYTLAQIGTHLDRTLEDMFDALESLEIPTLCAMNGSAYGGGTDLALACDFRIGVRGCKLFMPAARFGLHYYPGGLRRFVSRLGPTTAKKIFLTSMTLESEELLRIGFLTDLVECEGLQARINAYREGLFRCEPRAVSSMKRHIDAIMAGDWTEEMGRAAYEASLQSPETSQRLAELVAK
ncbi:enoyl-CoA hydratase/isomerase family protein [Caenimonas soli]|uniref:enoyl-CoA hydratase/isomerase family protein n=1 Tax=Caenimonas soli TaxID=2735555 RepID=UPI001556BB1E|nr:enoyl-CoA hydratase/isomerase family protein [Caenimonas soli]NPC57938.1 enoyl-CoA hydratase/isomerase family protein [Caenimonas soli]